MTMRRRARTLTAVVGAAVALTTVAAGPAFGCGGLIGDRGSVQLLRTTTFAGYTGGVEHYVTAFSFAGAGGAFGSLTPLPGVPTDVVKGGDWTLQRLDRETAPVRNRGAAGGAVALSADAEAKVLMDVDIDALDVTVLEGGARAVGDWAKKEGFRLPPDAPAVLDFYARRSPIFMAVRFDPQRAARQGVRLGDGIPVHVTIPTTNPWVPLRILGLGKQAAEQVEADVYLLTDREPTLLPAPSPLGTLELEHSEPASRSLLDDLRSDRGMEWVPASAHLTKLRVDANAAELTHDLAIDATGQGAPSLVAAGFELPDGAADRSRLPRDGVPAWLLFAVGALVGGLGIVVWTSRRLPAGPPAL
jgi:hypothetical protein